MITPERLEEIALMAMQAMNRNQHKRFNDIHRDHKRLMNERLKQECGMIKTWDDLTLPQLRLIEDAAIAAKTRATWIVQGLDNLPARPEYPTLAQDALKRADIDLTAAVLMIRVARQRYEALETINEDNLQAAE